MRHFIQQFGPALELPWTKRVAPQFTDALIDRVVGTARRGKRAAAASRNWSAIATTASRA
jgi:hypothetical protein